MRNYDINCDLGEGEPVLRTRSLMRLVTSANVACGGHAGDLKSIERCVDLAKANGTKLGAHPGFYDRENFGRKMLPIDGGGLELLLLQQMGALERIGARKGLKLHHIKLHGGLYHVVESDIALAWRYLVAVRCYWPGVIVYAFAGGTVQRLARGSGVEVWGEAFADRAYAADGTLVPRGRAGAVLTNAQDVASQVGAIVRVRKNVKTICIHGDTPDAVRIAKAVREVIGS